MTSADLIARIDAWATADPARLAQVSGGQRLTFAELKDRSDRLAASLSTELADDRSPVAILGHKEPEMLVAFLGCIKAGHPYVPLDEALRARADDIRAIARSRLTLTPEGVRHRVESAAAGGPRRPLEPSDTFYIIFTSGSTGKPKGVPITVACLLDFLAWMEDEQRFSRDEVFLNQVPYSFDVSILDTYLSLLNGGTVFNVSRELVANPGKLFAALPDSGMTVWTSTPAFVQMCLAEKRFDQQLLPRLTRFFLAGEALLPSTAAQLIERFPRAAVWNMYGPTEATVVVTSVHVTRDIVERYPTVPIGFPKPRGRIDIVDPEGRAVPPGEQGEIVIVGPTVSPGYLNPPDTPRPAFFETGGERAYRTGDLGYYRDGMVFFDGRGDDQIKLHGYRIELGDVEAHMSTLPAIQDVVVLPVMKSGRAESLQAFVILRERSDVSDFEMGNRLRAALADRLPVHMVPRKIRFVDRFPVNVNGKVDRRALAELS